MPFHAEVLADSIAPCGKRLTTFEITYPRMVHSELMTHRQLSRNSASSRAIPTKKMLAAVIRNPAMPVRWGRNQSGMQAHHDLTGTDRKIAIRLWLTARWFAVCFAWLMHKLGVHKQIVNRLLEPWMWITVIVSATEWMNFFALRDHPDAQPEIARIAHLMREAYNASQPDVLNAGEWHTPMVDADEASWLRERNLDPRAVSVGRCARVSYLTHHGTRDPYEDVKLHNKLKSSNPGHWSPFEHVAQALSTPIHSGNYVGFAQYRKEFPNECIS